jgi:DNA-binding NarL/FixJ family response regulator
MWFNGPEEWGTSLQSGKTGPASKTKAVVVDDDAMLCRSVVLGLKKIAGIECAGAFSRSAEALDEVPTLKPDILLVDLVMRGMTGVELIRELKVRLPELKVIIMTGLPRQDAVLAKHQAGADTFILKPLVPQAIRDAIAEIQAAKIHPLGEPDVIDREYLALVEAGLVTPPFLTDHGFAQWEAHKDVPLYWLKLAHQACYRVADFTKLYCWPSRHINHESHQLFGEALGGYLHRVRMVRAAYRLWLGKQPGVIAEQLYYRKVGHFTRAFHRFFPITTAEFVRTTRGMTWAECSKWYKGCSKWIGKRPNGEDKAAPERTLPGRTLEIASLLAKGLYYKEIAAQTGFSLSVVRKVISQLYDGLKVDNRIEAINVLRTRKLV